MLMGAFAGQSWNVYSAEAGSLQRGADEYGKTVDRGEVAGFGF